ncbi:MAG: hypothetical protein LUH04_09620, partial [Clostridium sp.]|nr:hypothetical protein [Clostridium sp.]
MKGYIAPVLAVLAASLGIWGFCRLVGMIRKAAYSAKVLKRVLERQADMLEETPKSVSGMTRVFLPQIQRDFPEFNWKEFQQKTENMVKSALRAIDARDQALLEDASEELRR